MPQMGDTVVVVCKLPESLHSLPPEPLRVLLALSSEREFLKGAGPVEMLKVFLSEKLSDDVEDRFGPYSDRRITSMADAGFVVSWTSDRKLGMESVEVGQCVASRLPYWNRYFERLLLEKARQHHVEEIERVLHRKWWQFWR